MMEFTMFLKDEEKELEIFLKHIKENFHVRFVQEIKELLNIPNNILGVFIHRDLNMNIVFIKKTVSVEIFDFYG